MSKHRIVALILGNVVVEHLDFVIVIFSVNKELDDRINKIKECQRSDQIR